MKIGKISICVELDGEIYAVSSPQDKLELLLQLCSSLNDDGKLHVVKMHKDYKFQNIIPEDKLNQ